MKAKPGDLRPTILENLALITTKQKANVERALSSFMEMCAGDVSIRPLSLNLIETQLWHKTQLNAVILQKVSSSDAHWHN